MAKYLADELELQSVANAIRAKGNTSESLAFPTDFVSAIADIPAGGNIEEDGNGNLTFSTDGNVIGKMPLAVSAGGTYTPPAGKAYSTVEVNIGGNKPSKDVNFRDYDGTIVNSYTKEGFLALTAMPANPSHDGLTAQGWNWSLANAQAYVAKYGRLEIGQMYITDDGKTRIYIHLEEGRTSPRLGLCANGTVDVDWGDGTAHDIVNGSNTATSLWTPTHHYAAPGDYVIKLTVSGSMRFSGVNTSNQYAALLRYSSGSDARNRVYQNAIRKIEIGNSIIIGNDAFSNCSNLSSITIPDYVRIDSYAFNACYSLSFITIPDGITSIGDYEFSSCYGLSSIAIPNSLIIIGDYAFNYCYGLSSIATLDSIISIGMYAFRNCNNFSSITIPDGVTSIGTNAFQSCYNLSSVVIPDGITSIGNYVFQGCCGLSSVVIPDSVTKIGNNAFNNCYGAAEYHLAPTTPPTLASVNAFSNIPSDCIIYVPYSEDHSILEAYKTATNWSTYASKIQEEPV